MLNDNAVKIIVRFSCLVIFSLVCGFLLKPLVAQAAVTFLDPGTAATNGTELWTFGHATFASDASTADGRSIKALTDGTNYAYGYSPNGVAANAGGRYSAYVYLPSVTPAAEGDLLWVQDAGDGATRIKVGLHTSGKVGLQLNGEAGYTYSNSPTILKTNTLTRITVTWKWTSTTVNETRLYINGNLEVSRSNITTGAFAISGVALGCYPVFGANFTAYFRHIYLDNSTALTDPVGAGNDLFVTAKRPFANGTAVNFTTGIGADPGSPYGSGHAVRENERPLSTTNGWSGVTTSSTTLNEEYNIENAATGDNNLTGTTILGVIGWMYANWDSATSQTAGIIVDNTYTAKTLTTSYAMYQQVSPNPTTYPAGTGTDIGMRKVTTTSTSRTGQLAESGILVAYTPALPVRVIRLSGKVKFTGKVKIY